MNAAIAAESWHRTTLNLIVAQYVVTANVERRDLQWLLMKSPAHIVFVFHALESDRFDEIVQDVVT